MEVKMMECPKCKYMVNAMTYNDMIHQVGSTRIHRDGIKDECPKCKTKVQNFKLKIMSF